MLAATTLPVSLWAVARVMRCGFTAASFEALTHQLAGMVVRRGPYTVTCAGRLRRPDATRSPHSPPDNNGKPRCRRPRGTTVPTTAS